VVNGGIEGERRRVPQPHGGTLTPHPLGSNGGVHRGPDRHPRVQVAGATLMKALMQEGPLLVITGQGRRQYRGKIPAAMVANLATRLTRIVSHGSDANVLRLLATRRTPSPCP